MEVRPTEPAFRERAKTKLGALGESSPLPWLAGQAYTPIKAGEPTAERVEVIELLTLRAPAHMVGLACAAGERVPRSRIRHSDREAALHALDMHDQGPPSSHHPSQASWVTGAG